MSPSLLPSSRTAAKLSLLVLAALVLAPGSASAQQYSSPYLTNRTLQYSDAENDPFNPLRYIPLLSLAALSTALWALLAGVLALFCWRHRDLFMLTAILGSLAYSIGQALKIGFRADTHDTGVYIAYYMFNTLSPCAMLATDYVLLGRIVRHLGCDQHLLVKASKTTKIFVISDVTTFLIQAAGGGLAANKTSLQLRDIGTKIFFAGILLQMVSFAFFTVISIAFVWKVRKHEPQLWAATDKETRRWKVLFFGMLWTCVGILIRSAFRTAELSEGFGGYLATHEVYIYALDTLPLFLAMVTYVPIYPGRFLQPGLAGAHPDAYDSHGKLKVNLSDPRSTTEEDLDGHTATPASRGSKEEKL